MDPNNSGLNGRFVETKKNVSRHSWHLRFPALVVAYGFCRDIICALFLNYVVTKLC